MVTSSQLIPYVVASFLFLVSTSVHAARTECVDIGGVGYSSYQKEFAERPPAFGSKFCRYTDTIENGTQTYYEVAYIKFTDGRFELRVRRARENFYFLMESGVAPTSTTFFGGKKYVFPKLETLLPQSAERFKIATKVPLSNKPLTEAQSAEAQRSAATQALSVPAYLTTQLSDVEYKITKNGEVAGSGDQKGGKSYDILSEKFTVLEPTDRVEQPVSESEIHTIRQMLESVTDTPTESVVLLADEGVDYETLLRGVRMKIPNNFKMVVVDASALNTSGGRAGVVDFYISALKTQARSEPTIFVMPEFKNFVGVGTHSGEPTGALEKLVDVIRSGEMHLIAIESADDYEKHIPQNVKRLLRKIQAPTIEVDQMVSRIQQFVRESRFNELDQFLIRSIVEYAEMYDFLLQDPQRSIRLTKQAMVAAKSKGRRDILREDIDAALFSAYQVKLDFLNPDKVDERLTKLKSVMDEMVIGLDRHKQAFYDNFVNAARGFHDHRGPAISMLMTGPAGTGKTEFCQAAAKGMGVPIELITFSQFRSPNDLPKVMSKIVSALSKNPYTVICLDEVEKSAKEVQESLLNMLNDKVFSAEIEDARGDKRTVKASAKFATVIATSNLLDRTIRRWYDEEKHLRPIRGSTWRDSETVAAIKTAKTESTYGETTLSEPMIDRFKILLPVYPLELSTFKALIVKAVRSQIEIAKKACRCEIVVTNEKDWIDAIAFPLFSHKNSNRDVSKFVAEFVAKEIATSKKSESGYTITLKDPYVLPSETAPWDDPQYLEKTKDLDVKIKSEILGQDLIIDRIVESFKSHLGRKSDRRRPLAFYFMGTTGTGKTELAKVIAKYAFAGGTEGKYIEIIPMGEVTDDNKWADVMDYTRGGKCTDEDIKKFERSLRKTMAGGVIVFDEFSNVGGSDKGMRNRYAKMMYNLLDEGKWTSPCTGIEYDLSNRVIVFTGNDGEENFFGLSAEDLRIATWEEISKPNVVRQLALSNGIPEAFIERIAGIYYFKPLAILEAIGIAKKILSRSLGIFKNEVEFIYDDQFVFELVRATFSSQNGGRGVRRFIENVMPSIITDAMVSFKESKGASGGSGKVKIKLKIKDNLNPSPYVKDLKERRQVELVTQVTQGAVSFEKSKDISSYAQSKTPVTQAMAYLVAFHEMGHAVVNNPQLTGEVLSFVTIEGLDGYLGYARYKPMAVQNPNRHSLVMSLAKMYAGSLAQQIAGYPKDSGWANDLQQMRNMVFKYIVTYGLNRRFLGVTLDKDNNPILKGKDLIEYRDFANQVMGEAREAALAMLENNWDIVREGVTFLMNRGSMRAEEFQDIVTRTLKNRDSSQTTYKIDPKFKRDGIAQDDLSDTDDELKKYIAEAYRMSQSPSKWKLTPRIIKQSKSGMTCEVIFGDSKE